MKFRLTGAASLVVLVIAPGALADERTQLVDAVLITIQGQRVVDGCQYEGAVTVLPGQAAIEQNEISEDAATCTMVMEQGTPVGGGPEEVKKGVASLEVGKKATAARAARGFSAASATTHSAGYSKTWLTDPCPAPCIVVNSVQNSIDWYWDGPYLTPGMVETCTARYEWAWQTGWGRHENNLQCNFDSPWYPQSWIDSTSFVHFKNGVFCFFTDTHVYYDRNHAIGYGDGRLVGRWRVTKSGACSGLLSVHNRTARTMN